MTIFINTFRSLLKWKSTLIFIVIMSILPIILGFVLKNEIYGKDMAFQSQLDFTIGIYYILVFMWGLGIPFLIVISAKGISLIANEITEGTLGLLVSMKISRFQIVLYKWLALYFVVVLLGILSIYENISILSLISDMDKNILNKLIESIPFLIQHILIMGFIFSNIAILLSLLIKSKIFATISMTFFIVIVFLIIPLFKNFLTSYYEKYNLYLYDLNYHFSLIYYHFISKSNISISPTLQTVMGTFIGIFDIKKITDNDMSVLLKSSLMKDAAIYSYLSSNILILFWLFISIICLFLSMRILTKRDIT
ncbi:ABC transporter permease [Mycoplasmatota bacterium]|nr:ABC transporter permease [Mycoplasmatota bacterium]